MLRLLAAVTLVISCRAALARRPCLPPCSPCLPPCLPSLTRPPPASCSLCHCLCLCAANRAKARSRVISGRLCHCRPRRAAHGYQLAPSCSCGGAYNLVANTVAQKYTEQQQQQQYYGPPAEQQYGGAPGQQQYVPPQQYSGPSQQQYSGPPQQYYGPPRWPTQCTCAVPGVPGVPTVSGVVVPQPKVERLGPATEIETPAPIMQNPEEFGTRTYEEAPEGGRVCEDCGGSPAPASRVMTIPPRYAQNNAVAPVSQPQRYNRYAIQPQQQPQPQPQQPLYASCPAAVLYPAPQLLYTPVMAAPLQQPQMQPQIQPQQRFAPGVFRPQRSSPPQAPAAPAPTKTNDDDILKTFTIHSASDPVDLNSVAAALAAAPNSRQKSSPALTPGSKSQGDCSVSAKPPTGK